MSNKKLLLRRGSEDEHNSFIGDVGEITYVTGTTLSDPEIRIHDGSTPGGIRVRGVTSAGTLSNARNINVADGEGGLLETGWSISAGTLTETLTVNGHLYPNQNDAYDLGNAEYKFRDLYLSDATIYFGEEGVTDKEQFATLSIDREAPEGPALTFKKRNADIDSFKIFTQKDLTTDDDISGDIDQDRVKILKPKQIKDLITNSLSGVAGGMDYKGGLNPSSLPVGFENSNKGDLYVIQSAGTLTAGGENIYFDQGDHLIVKAEGGLGGTLTGIASKIDKLDTQDRVTSVAGKTGAISLTAADVDGLADVASSGLYGQLTGLPQFGTAASLNAGTFSGGIIQLSESNTLPALDGSNLINLPAAAGGSGTSLGNFNTYLQFTFLTGRFIHNTIENAYTFPDILTKNNFLNYFYTFNVGFDTNDTPFYCKLPNVNESVTGKIIIYYYNPQYSYNVPITIKANTNSSGYSNIYKINGARPNEIQIPANSSIELYAVSGDWFWKV